jgi:hypothetical protein
VSFRLDPDATPGNLVQALASVLVEQVRRELANGDFP